MMGSLVVILDLSAEQPIPGLWKSKSLQILANVSWETKTTLLEKQLAPKNYSDSYISIQYKNGMTFKTT